MGRTTCSSAAAVRVLAPAASATNFTSITISARFDDGEPCGDDGWDDG
jgi:hypothetical protein